MSAFYVCDIHAIYGLKFGCMGSHLQVYLSLFDLDWEPCLGSANCCIQRPFGTPLLSPASHIVTRWPWNLIV